MNLRPLATPKRKLQLVFEQRVKLETGAKVNALGIQIYKTYDF